MLAQARGQINNWKNHYMLNFGKASAFRSALLLSVGLAAPGATFTLNCYIPGAGTTCTTVANPYGTVSITDIVGGVSVNVVTATGGKFKDLLLNNNAASPVMDAPVVYSSNAFSLSPYSGTFDVDTGRPNGGWNSNTPFSITGTGFDAASFVQLDSAGVLYVIVHLQQINCDANGANCVAGTNSIKVGGSLAPPPDDPPGDDPIPEPATYAIVGLGLGAAHLLRKRG